MTLKNKKGNAFFGPEKDEKHGGVSSAENIERKEDAMMKEEREPYMVFETEAEFNDAVEQELKKRFNSDENRKHHNTATASMGAYKDTERTNHVPDGDAHRRKLIEQWQKEAAELGEIVPDFDFASALRNETFKNALTSGKSVFAAYSEMTRMPKNPQRADLYQNARSPRRGTGEASINPAKLSSEDFKKYIDKIKNQ